MTRQEQINLVKSQLLKVNPPVPDDILNDNTINEYINIIERQFCTVTQCLKATKTRNTVAESGGYMLPNDANGDNEVIKPYIVLLDGNEIDEEKEHEGLSYDNEMFDSYETGDWSGLDSEDEMPGDELIFEITGVLVDNVDYVKIKLSSNVIVNYAEVQSRGAPSSDAEIQIRNAVDGGGSGLNIPVSSGAYQGDTDDDTTNEDTIEVATDEYFVIRCATSGNIQDVRVVVHINR